MVKEKNIAYVKDKSSKFNTMTNALKSIVNCESIGLDEIFQGSHFGHVFSSACQYGTTYEKKCRSFKYISTKFTHVNMQKCIIWLNFFGNGKQKLEKACVEVGLCLRKLNTLMKTRYHLLLIFRFFFKFELLQIYFRI